MKKILMAMVVGALMMTATALPAGAGPPERGEENFAIAFPDFENGFAVFVNTTRDAICTDERIDAEIAFLRWFPIWGDAFFQYLDENMGDPEGFPGEFPPEAPPWPEGIDALSTSFNETGKGAIVFSEGGTKLHVELWRLVEQPPGVGPCTDTFGMEQAFATGTGMSRQNDNDLFGSGTRGNSFGGHLVASLRTADGNNFQYHSRFHVNSRCHGGESEPPACLLDWTKLG
jgi:hypothetical protein